MFEQEPPAGADLINSTASEPERVVVLLSLRAPDGTTRFVDQIVYQKPSYEVIRYFSWRTAILGSYDVFHLHWPEWILRHPRRPVRWAKACLALMFLLRLGVTGTPVVRTLHNLEPHRKGSAFENFIVRGFDRLTSDFIVLNPLTPTNGRTTLIRHGHYVDRFEQHPRGTVIPGRILFFGRIEPYKKVDSLIARFAEIPGDHLSLRLVGSIQKGAFPDDAAGLVSAAGAVPRVSSAFEFVSDEQLVREISEAQLVVLHYSEMHNSGALLVALSLGRVVLSTPSSVNEWMQEEVGAQWLILEPDLTPAALTAAVESAAKTAAAGATPDLANRNWREVALQHYRVYVAAIHSANRNRPWKR